MTHASLRQCSRVSPASKRRFANLLQLLGCVAALSLSQSANAAVITTSDCLPPLGPHFKYLGDVNLNFGGIAVLTDVVHSGFTACTSPPIAGSLVESFGSFVSFDVSVGGGPFNSFTAPASVQVRVTFDHLSGNTRFFDTEMLQLDISGGNLPPGVIVRESPTHQSLGETTIEDIGGGLFEITSFFDIFTELSLDNGATFIPASGPGHVELSVPEPASLGLLGLGLVGLGIGRYRRA